MHFSFSVCLIETKPSAAVRTDSSDAWNMHVLGGMQTVWQRSIRYWIELQIRATIYCRKMYWRRLYVEKCEYRLTCMFSACRCGEGSGRV